MSLSIRQLQPDDGALMEALLTTFGDAFEDAESYAGNRPTAAYLRQLLGSDYFIALAALENGEVVGGIAAYELKKFEQERSEIYIYDLAVSAGHRREGIATALITELKVIAATRGAYFILVALGVSASAFGLMHIFYGGIEGLLYSIVVAVKAGAGGLLLGWIFWRWGLPYSFACHGTANAVHMLLIPVVF